MYRSPNNATRLISAATAALFITLGAEAMTEIPPVPATSEAELSGVYIVNEGDFAGVLITVQRLDQFDGEATVHVEAEQLLSVDSATDWTVQPLIGHMPFTAAAFAASDLELIAEQEGVTDTFTAGFENWRSRYATGQAGIYDVPVEEALGQVLVVRELPDVSATTPEEDDLPEGVVMASFAF